MLFCYQELEGGMAKHFALKFQIQLEVIQFYLDLSLNLASVIQARADLTHLCNSTKDC